MYYPPQLSNSQVPIEQVVRAYLISRNEWLLHSIIKHYQLVIEKAASHLAKKYNISDSGVLEKSDFSSAGVCGLIDALNRFEPERGVPLEVFASRRIKGEILDELRRYGYLPRTVIQRANAFDRFRYAGEDAYAMAAKEIGTTEEKIRRAVWIRDNGRFFIDDNLAEREDFAVEPDQEIRLIEKEQLKYVNIALNSIPARERRAIIDNAYNDMTGAEIGKSGNLGNQVSEARANQLRRRGLEKLAESLSSLN